MKSGIEIRIATLSDTDDVLRLFGLLSDHHTALDQTHNVAWRDTEEAAGYFNKRVQQGTVWVATDGTDVIGYLAGHVSKGPIYRTLESVAEIQNMLVVDAYRGQGVGSKLVEQFCAWCAEQGIAQITIDALAANPEAVEFYRGLRFVDYVLTLERKMEHSL